jgi:hypothetical protein
MVFQSFTQETTDNNFNGPKFSNGYLEEYDKTTQDTSLFELTTPSIEGGTDQYSDDIAYSIEKVMIITKPSNSYIFSNNKVLIKCNKSEEKDDIDIYIGVEGYWENIKFKLESHDKVEENDKQNNNFIINECLFDNNFSDDEDQ